MTSCTLLPSFAVYEGSYNKAPACDLTKAFLVSGLDFKEFARQAVALWGEYVVLPLGTRATCIEVHLSSPGRETKKMIFRTVY
ncbi:MAG: hypothetical protein TQ37_00510 [Candidatus Synechococcus spongiarum 15L]|uniref:Uncharacterized protein n=3 Tax=Candidatus Synechococcus spongiarum TaxID=431041 RepID=A0A1T1CZP3_9SYNE|nr:MAG: hypothetical protein TQ37_00510 [Candidatus Synechococcus spongiarum 15L]OOV34089.1 hypothetical protein BV61_03525 [Candidatus Synechococcus spongiarum LMB bulk15M]OOV35608.1 hypothetical protein BV53_03525 [Candidatus Synechococcus spongiarum LMB bulk15N]